METDYEMQSPVDDSGMSTMDSSCSRVRSSPQAESLAEILMNEHNNNVSADFDVVKLLELKSTDDEEQHSNSSSLISINSLQNHQGSEERDEEGEIGSLSTSCSEDSFEMSSACSIQQSNGLLRDSRETTCESFDELACRTPSNQTLNEGFERCMPSSSYSVDSFIEAAKRGALHPKPSLAFEQIRSRVAAQIDQLDTGLPDLDFDKLERQLNSAVREREEQERRMLGEEVRRRLALQADIHVGPSPQVYTKPHRSNLALRLQTAMNLQVCYMNEMSESESENEDDSDDDSDIEMGVRKSKSAPNLKGQCKQATREAMRAKMLQERIRKGEILNKEERTEFLHHESNRVVQVAGTASEKALAEHRRHKSRASDVPRQARQYLTKKKLSDIDSIRKIIENAINRKNMELVQLLLERDSLHMEHDSLKVDIDDFTQHDSQASALNLAQLLQEQETLGQTTSNPLHRIRREEPPQPRKPRTKVAPVPATPLTTPTSPSLSFASVIPSSLSMLQFFKR